MTNDSTLKVMTIISVALGIVVIFSWSFYCWQQTQDPEPTTRIGDYGLKKSPEKIDWETADPRDFFSHRTVELAEKFLVKISEYRSFEAKNKNWWVPSDGTLDLDFTLAPMTRKKLFELGFPNLKIKFLNPLIKKNPTFSQLNTCLPNHEELSYIYGDSYRMGEDFIIVKSSEEADFWIDKEPFSAKYCYEKEDFTDKNFRAREYSLRRTVELGNYHGLWERSHEEIKPLFPAKFGIVNVSLREVFTTESQIGWPIRGIILNGEYIDICKYSESISGFKDVIAIMNFKEKRLIAVTQKRVGNELGSWGKIRTVHFIVSRFFSFLTFFRKFFQKI